MEVSPDYFSKSENSGAPVLAGFFSDRSTLIVSFGGMTVDSRVPYFEFYKMLSPFNVKKLYVRDLRQCWYHRGIPGVSCGIESVHEHLQRKPNGLKIERLITIGNSAGGYAAVLFGFLMNADEVHAFSPKTFINPIKRIVNRDCWCWDRILRLLFSRTQKRRYFDLEKVLPGKNAGTRFHLYFSGLNRVDAMHSRRMSKIPNTFLEKYEDDSHELALNLKKSGELQKILSTVLG